MDVGSIDHLFGVNKSEPYKTEPLLRCTW